MAATEPAEALSADRASPEPAIGDRVFVIPTLPHYPVSVGPLQTADDLGDRILRLKRYLDTLTTRVEQLNEVMSVVRECGRLINEGNSMARQELAALALPERDAGMLLWQGMQL